MNNNDTPPSRPTSGRQNATSAQDTTLHSEPVTNRFAHLTKPFNFEDMAKMSANPEEEAARRQAEAEAAGTNNDPPYSLDDIPPSYARLRRTDSMPNYSNNSRNFGFFREQGGTRKNRNSKRSMRSKRSSRHSKRSSRRSKRSSRRSRR